MSVDWNQLYYHQKFYISVMCSIQFRELKQFPLIIIAKEKIDTLETNRIGYEDISPKIWC